MQNTILTFILLFLSFPAFAEDHRTSSENPYVNFQSSAGAAECITGLIQKILPAAEKDLEVTFLSFKLKDEPVTESSEEYESATSFILTTSDGTELDGWISTVLKTGKNSKPISCRLLARYFLSSFTLKNRNGEKIYTLSVFHPRLPSGRR